MKQHIAGWTTALLVTLSALAPAHAAVDVPSCQLLDRSLRPAWESSLSLIPSSDIEAFGSAGFVEWDIRGDLGYFHNLWRSDMALSAASELTLINDSTGMDLPDSLWAFQVQSLWTWRYAGGSALQAGLHPGLYAATDTLGGGSFRIPLSLAGIRRFNDDTSGILGGSLRFGFNDWFMPIAGIVWQPSPGFRGEFLLPETRLFWFPNRIWSFHSGLEWNNLSYRIDPTNDLGHERLTLEDFRLTVGSSYFLGDSLFARFEAGSIFARRLELDESNRDSATVSTDPDSTIFFRLSIQGPF